MKKYVGKLKSFSFFDTFKHASVYFIGTILMQGLGIISLPVITYFLDEAQYGIASIYLTYSTMVAVIFAANLYSPISRYYFEKDAQLNGFLTTIFVAMNISFFLFAIPTYIWREALASTINLPVETIGYMLIFAYTIMIWSIYHQLRVCERKSKEVTIAQIILQYSKFVFTVVGLWWIGKNVSNAYLGKLIGEVVAASIVGIWVLWTLRKHWDWAGMRWEQLRYALHFSLPHIPYALGGYFLAYFDAWIINASIGNEDAGLYSFAYKIGFLMFGLINAFQNASLSGFTKMMDERNGDAISTQVLSIHKLTVVGAMFLILFSVDVGTLLSAKASFRTALTVVPIITIGYVFYGMSMLFCRNFNYLKLNIYLTVTLLFAGTLNVLLNLYYIPLYGYEAAAYTTLISYIVMAFVSWILAVYWLKIPPLPIFSMLLQLIPLALVSFLFYYMHWQDQALNIFNIFIKGLLLAGIALILYIGTIKRILFK